MDRLWPAAMSNVSEARRDKRIALAKETLIARSRPGLFLYPVLAFAYIPLVVGNAIDAIATLCAAFVLLVFSLVRWRFYRAEMGPSFPIWRRRFALLACVNIMLFDTLIAFELWHRDLDARAIVLLVGSVALRASSTYAASLDLRFHTALATWTRIPMLASLVLIGSDASFALVGLLALHAAYIHLHSKQLNAEFWQAAAATEALEDAHEKLKHEVEMRERAEVELRLAQKLESVGRLATGIAHEINTPLQAMIGSLEFLREATEELLAMAQPRPEQVSELEYLRENLPSSLQITQECVERTAAIVRSVKTFAHPELSKKAPLDINAAIQTTLDISRHEYAMVADVKTDLGELPLVECYAGELNQALLNLVINAAHAIGDVTTKTGARGTITIATSVADAAVRIAISDTGGGIPDGIRERIFDPFFTTKPIGQGTGQGLAVVRSVIAKRHGGQLRLDTQLGRGTTFEILLPLRAQAIAA